jgi:hypothetical protein
MVMISNTFPAALTIDVVQVPQGYGFDVGLKSLEYKLVGQCCMKLPVSTLYLKKMHSLCVNQVYYILEWFKVKWTAKKNP